MTAHNRATALATSASLLRIERALDAGSRALRQGRAHVGALIPKGDRDFATNVDLTRSRAETLPSTAGWGSPSPSTS